MAIFWRDGTATGGVDFVTDTGTLVFTDTVTTQTIQVALLNDSVVEADKDFTILLSDALGGATLGTADTATITITDLDVAAPELPVEPAPAPPADDDNGIFGLGLSWMTYGLLALGLLLRRRRI